MPTTKQALTDAGKALERLGAQDRRAHQGMTASASIGLKSPVHRYQQVTRELLDAIQNGTYPVGSLLPGELEIAETFRIGRNTARTAIHQLVEMGMVSRRKRAGTRVEAVAPKNVYTAAISSLPDLLEDATRSYLQVVSVEQRQVLPATLEPLQEGGETLWLLIKGNRVHTSTHAPISSARIFVPQKYEGITPELKGKVPWIHVLLGAQFGLQVYEVAQHVTSYRVTKALSHVLQCLPGPGLQVTRSYFDKSGECFLIAQNFHPANGVSIMTRWRLEGKFS